MEDVKFILKANKNMIKKIIVFLFLFQVFYAFVAFFLDKLNWLVVVQNALNVVSWAVIIYVPFWLARKLVNQKEYIPRYPLWLLGMLLNGLLSLVFSLLWLIDLFVQIFFFDIKYVFYTSKIFIVTSLLGIIIILIVGSIAASFAAKKKIK